MSLIELIGLAAMPEGEELLAATLKAHFAATLANNNGSSAALILSASSGAPLQQSIASALLMVGGRFHAPIQQARSVIYGWSLEDIETALESGERVPGWGNSFFKEEIDPAWTGVDSIITRDFPEHAERLEEITKKIIAAKDRKITPNAAAFTAATAQIIGLPFGLEQMLLIIGRLPAWGSQYLRNVN